jgi:hypothetical protein
MRPIGRDASSHAALMRHGALQYDASAVTCQLDVRGARACEICVVPHWDPSSAAIERYDARPLALLRHAEVTRRLRENGWMVIDHVATESIHAVA